MAAAVKVFRLAPRASVPQLPRAACRVFSTTSFRTFNSSRSRSARRGDDLNETDAEGPVTENLFESMLENDNALSIEEKGQLRKLREQWDSETDAAKSVNDDLFLLQDQMPEEEPIPPEPRFSQGFFAMDEERDDQDPDPVFEPDDITSMAHGELEQHRELREFARVIAWDMPLLFRHTKPFKPPEKHHPLRFRYTTYLGETHPAARKVVMEFSPSDITPLQSFNNVQAAKLIKLLGARYNPETEVARMSCEMFPTIAQNKRYLGDLLQKLLKEVKEGKDTFEDVPFDFRYHKPKPKYEFPEEWKLTEKRKEELESQRKEKQHLEGQKQAMGQLLNGKNIIGRMLHQDLTEQAESVVVSAGRSKQPRIR